jgi:hypothetical protein
MSKTTAPIASINSFSLKLKQEILILSGLFVLFLLFNLSTYSRFPIVWLDEVMYTDPAANLYLGNGFTSSVWFAQGMDEFWASNVPLHQILLYAWMHLFGFSLLSVRSFNYILIIAAVTILWLAVIRLNLVTSSLSRILLIFTILLGYGVSVNYRSGRPDCITILLMSLGLLAYSISSLRWRLIVLGCIGVFLPISGLQTIPFTIIICGLSLLFLGKSFLKEVVALAIGITIGIAFLYILYSTNGVWDDFRATVSVHSFIGTNNASKGFNFLIKSLTGTRFTRDTSLVFLLISSISLTIYQVRNDSFRLRSPITFALIESICTVIGMFAVGRFPSYYSWMAYIPLAIGTFSAFSTIKFNWKNLLHKVFAIFIVITCLSGSVLQAAVAVSSWNYRDYKPVEELVNKNITNNDWVYFDRSAYYPLKNKTNTIFLFLDILSTEEKHKISALVINPDDLDASAKKLGG